MGKNSLSQYTSIPSVKQVEGAFSSVAPIYKFADIPIYRCLSKNTADIDNDTDINTLMINSVCELSIAIKFLKGWFLNKLDNSRGRFRKSLRNY